MANIVKNLDTAMNHFSTVAIILNRRLYSDFDLIVTALSRDYGKCTLIAKSAKKSVRRFPGGLEPLSQLQIAYRSGRDNGLFILEEASIENSFSAIRTNIHKTAYASYWAELIALWLEANQAQPAVFRLLAYALSELDRSTRPDALINIMFQMRFIGQEGFRPILEHCTCCRTALDDLAQSHIDFDLKQGGIVCRQCPVVHSAGILISKGTLKQLQWLLSSDLPVAERVRFSPRDILEATDFLQAFIPYHLGRTPKSLKFLNQIGSAKNDLTADRSPDSRLSPQSIDGRRLQ